MGFSWSTARWVQGSVLKLAGLLDIGKRRVPKLRMKPGALSDLDTAAGISGLRVISVGVLKILVRACGGIGEYTIHTMSRKKYTPCTAVVYCTPKPFSISKAPILRTLVKLYKSCRTLSTPKGSMHPYSRYLSLKVTIRDPFKA